VTAPTRQSAESSEEFQVSNGQGLSMTVGSFGARLVELAVPDRDGKLDNVVLGFADAESYRQNVDLYFGATVGRVAGRIARGEFSLDGHHYTLTRNEGANHLHGGPHRGLDRVEWSAQSGSTEHGPGVVFTYTSPHMEEGYPGTLKLRAEYALSDRNELWTVLTAESDAATPVNLTNHSYWTLNGGRPGSILQHELMIAAGRIVSMGPDLIPTGELSSVVATAWDFRRARPLRERLPKDTVEPWPGFDNAYVLDDHDELDIVASLWDPVSGRCMQIRTSEPSLQVYTANRLDDMSGRGGKRYGAGSAICLEPQRMPDAVNQTQFPPITLAAGQVYRHVSCYEFSVR